ncbi:hypothetical protein PsYK624_097340 [Phanerochaete sordida]|uniref:Uncharacterized protein n=1 Tax=Phanerochaete sordida TaxID=48140 RepID=A0A9P3GEX8_9APHY|nr:hypothetical protein PsYK624_097340 [Phanerochaete sordida]
MPFDFAARQSQASPSVSLEKGAYRMRPPARRSGLASALTIDTVLANAKTRRPRDRTRRGSHGTSRDGLHHIVREESRLAMLIIALVCAAVTSFAGAYYLVTTSPRI